MVLKVIRAILTRLRISFTSYPKSPNFKRCCPISKCHHAPIFQPLSEVILGKTHKHVLQTDRGKFGSRKPGLIMKKHTKTLAVLCAVLLSCVVHAQNRTFDGHSNNLFNPQWGSTGEIQLYYGGIDYADGMNAPGGADRPNSRELSNYLFDQAQEEIINSPMELSDFVWSFGQFLDHDITAVPESEEEAVMIQIPECDQYFDPFCEGNKVMPIHRNTAAPGTGTSTSNPRKAMNDITAFIDASNVYGSDQGRATLH